jgi:rubrerythrin
MSRTEEFLKEAFAGESQTNRKYLAFAAKADQEGFPQVARLFRAAARSETIHAHIILRALGWVRTTKENLQEAMTSETNAYKNRYPAMIEAAKSDGNKDAEKAFTLMKRKRFTLSSIKKFSILLRALRRIILITYAPSAVLQRNENLLKSAQSVEPKERCSEG